MHQCPYLIKLLARRFSRPWLAIISILLMVGEVHASALSFNEKKVPTTQEDLVEIQNALVEHLETARAATVSIRVGEGFGSGVIVTADGLILTAAHVTAAVGEELTVVFNDGSEHKAVSMGLDSESDAAMMRIIDGGEYPYVDINRDNDYKLGHWVFALGHSGGFDGERGPVVRLGRIVKQDSFTLHSDCKVIGGDSGGPLFDMRGNLIGIHSRVSYSVEHNMHVPVREYLAHWEELKDDQFLGEGPFAKRPVKGSGFLGFASSDTDDGLLIDEVLEDGPAAMAGIEVGDIVIQLDGMDIKQKEDLKSVLEEKASGQKVDIVLIREGEQIELSIKLGKR